MSVRVETTYLATCDYPDCHMTYDFWELTEEDAILEVIDNGEWLSFSGVRTPAFRPVAKRLYLCHAGRFWFSMYRLNVSSGAPPAVPA